MQDRALKPHADFRFLTELMCWIGGLAVFTTCLAGVVLAVAALSAPPRGHGPTAAQVAASPALPDSGDAAADTAARQQLLAFIERKPAAFEALAPFDPVPGRSAEPDPAELIEAGSGKPFRDNSANGDPCVRCPELVVVPSGTFNMGSTEGEAWRLDWQREREAPSTNVAIAKPLAVARFAVTFDEWAACAAAGDCLDTPGDSGWGRGNRPVINITWDEANAYVGWLSRKTGRSYRLLSEAEREYMARAGTATPFWFGTAPAPKQANYLPVSAGGNTSTAPSTEMTLPVNSFEPNPWGLYNVHGNVWDWTADCWNDNHRGHPGTGAAVLTGDCRHRVLKGGSWFHPPMLMRAAARTRASTDLRANSIGLRVARNIGSGARN